MVGGKMTPNVGSLKDFTPNINIWVLFDLKKQEKSPRAIYGSQRPEQPVNVNFKPIIRGLKSDIFD